MDSMCDPTRFISEEISAFNSRLVANFSSSRKQGNNNPCMWVITEFNRNSKSAFHFCRYSGSNVLVSPRSERTFWARDHPKKSKPIFGYTSILMLGLGFGMEDWYQRLCRALRNRRGVGGGRAEKRDLALAVVELWRPILVLGLGSRGKWDRGTYMAASS